MFLDSVDLCFKNKDPSIPVAIEIRPVVNGYPDSLASIPGSHVELDPSNVNITNTDNGELIPTFSDPTTFTNFKFPFPIHLSPNTEYALVVMSNSNLYETYVAEIGALQLGSRQQITAQPYTGSFFESQNASTWTAIQTQDLMFRLNKCVFDTAGSVDLVLGDFNQKGAFDYDVFWLNGNNLVFNGIADANFGLFPTNTSNVFATSATPVLLKNNIYLTERQRLDIYSTDVNAVTSQLAYTVPFLNCDADSIDVAIRDSSAATEERIVSKAKYFVRPKVGGSAGQMELVFQSTLGLPTTGQVLRFINCASTTLHVDLTSTDTNVSPMIDMTQLAMRFIQNEINNAGITAQSIDPPTDTDIVTPYIVLSSPGGSGAFLACIMAGGALFDVQIVSGGTGYTDGNPSTDTATITTTQSPGVSVQATIQLKVESGVITGVTITNPGSGYKQATLQITSTDGSGASIYPLILQETDAVENSGVVIGWDIVDAGLDYLDAWTATMYKPDLLTSGTTPVPLVVHPEGGVLGGNAVTRYISRRVTLNDGFDAQDLIVYLDAMKPVNTGVDVYYRVLSSADNTDWSARPWVQMVKVPSSQQSSKGTGDVVSTSLTDYKEMQFNTVGGSAVYSGFDTYKIFAVKIVLTTPNTTSVPRIKNLRAIALATTFIPS